MHALIAAATFPAKHVRFNDEEMLFTSTFQYLQASELTEEKKEGGGWNLLRLRRRSPDLMRNECRDSWENSDVRRGWAPCWRCESQSWASSGLRRPRGGSAREKQEERERENPVAMQHAKCPPTAVSQPADPRQKESAGPLSSSFHLPPSPLGSSPVREAGPCASAHQPGLLAFTAPRRSAALPKPSRVSNNHAAGAAVSHLLRPSCRLICSFGIPRARPTMRPTGFRC